MFAMRMFKYFISVGVVSGHMEKPGKEHGNGCFGIKEARISPTMVATN
jgi:hypothetical protein